KTSFPLLLSLSPIDLLALFLVLNFPSPEIFLDQRFGSMLHESAEPSMLGFSLSLIELGSSGERESLE
ncbi:hypothetical protein LINPERPRIM_LOCUS3171, partial [Linum perenne]